MKTFKIEMREELVNYIERLNFEVNAKERIVKTIVSSDLDGNLMENQSFLKYNERYEIAFAEYEVAKQEVENMIPEDIRKNHQIFWNLDFRTNTLEVTVNCDCFDNQEYLF